MPSLDSHFTALSRTWQLAGKQTDIDRFVEFCNTSAVQSSIGAYLASLKKQK